MATDNTTRKSTDDTTSTATGTSAISAWFLGRLPDAWTSAAAPEISIDREEITVVVTVPAPELADDASDTRRPWLPLVAGMVVLAAACGFGVVRLTMSELQLFLEGSALVGRVALSPVPFESADAQKLLARRAR